MTTPSEFDREVLSQTLRDLREKRGENLRTFAEWLGVPLTTLWRLEQMQSDPSVATLQILLVKLNLSPTKFLRRKA